MDWQAAIGESLDTGWIRLGLGALGAAALALVGWRGERRRKRRSDPDAVSWVPWLGLTFWSSCGAMLLLAAAILAWLKD